MAVISDVPPLASPPSLWHRARRNVLHPARASHRYCPMTDTPAAPTTNPFFEDWTAPFAVPPFARIAPEHFRRALERGFADHDAEIAAIAGNAAAPSFGNTIAALERSGQPLRRVNHFFHALAGAHTNDAIQEIEREYSPRQARHWNGIYLNEPL